MATIFSDDFNRSDNADMGANWTDNAGDMQIKSNQMYANNMSSAYCNTAPGNADYDTSVVVYHSGADSRWCEPYMRGTGATKWDNSYWLYIQNEPSDHFMYVFKRVSGSQTTLSSKISLSTDVGNYTYKLSCNGTAIKAYVDGVEKYSGTDSALSNAGVAGVRMNNGFYCDDFLIEGTASSPATAIKDLISMGIIAFPR
jgi:hypothetical protein